MRHPVSSWLKLVFLAALTGCAASGVSERDSSEPLPAPPDARTLTRSQVDPVPVRIDILDDPTRTSVSYYGPWLEAGSDADKFRYLLAATRPRGTDSVSYWILFSNIYTDVSWRDWNRLTLADGRILEMKSYERNAGVCAEPLGTCGYSEHLRALIGRIHLEGPLHLKAYAKRGEFLMRFPSGYTKSLIEEAEGGS